MKVKELIEQLQKLDQEEDIWTFYNETEWVEPNIVVCDESSAKYGYKYLIE